MIGLGHEFTQRRRRLLPPKGTQNNQRCLVVARLFCKTAGKGKLDETMAALMQWLDRLQLMQSPARLRQFIEEFGDDPGRRQTQKFITAFSENNDDGWNAGGTDHSNRSSAQQLSWTPAGRG